MSAVISNLQLAVVLDLVVSYCMSAWSIVLCTLLVFLMLPPLCSQDDNHLALSVCGEFGLLMVILFMKFHAGVQAR